MQINLQDSSPGMPPMPGGPKTKFRSFVTDMKKDFPTIDEFIDQKKKVAV